MHPTPSKYPFCTQSIAPHSRHLGFWGERGKVIPAKYTQKKTNNNKKNVHVILQQAERQTDFQNSSSNFTEKCIPDATSSYPTTFLVWLDVRAYSSVMK